MNKFKFTVETKSRSKVVVEVELDNTLQELRSLVAHENVHEGTLIIGNHFFNASNVNYVKVEQIEVDDE
jgi:hypothetical protein